MIRILLFVVGIWVLVEYLIYFKMELRQTSFLSNVLYFSSGGNFGRFLSPHYLRKEIRQNLSNEIDGFFSRYEPRIEWYDLCR